ncbi:MAG: formate--tetrahydrofolate ligase [Defluviitaleaceae bacterium]|nr:formate--tetrahydrofolate ligase [Defluviitaleaceae bacterium]
MDSDIKIAQETKMLPIQQIADKLGIPACSVTQYGEYKAKINHKYSGGKKAKVVLVTAISPTPLGEGKTTTTVGLGDALSRLGKKTAVCLREPSLGPVFGVKGGAAGGGYSQVVPMEDINLHFTGDIHAISAANNLLAALIDNHIYHGNGLRIDPRRITWRRALDMNDRQLRFVVNGLGKSANGTPREDGFDITAASEIMAVFCLSENFEILKRNMSNIIVAYSFDGKPVTAGELKAEGAMTALLRDAFEPNLVQTLEHTPAFIHGGPFANIAHGCNSMVATLTAATLCDYVVTEAGFGADLGAEKFIDIKCRRSGIVPSAAVIVATVRALAHHGGGSLQKGVCNLERHIENIKNVYGLPVVVAVNKFGGDTETDLEYVADAAKSMGVRAEKSEVFEKGGAGGAKLGEAVLAAADEKNSFKFVYQSDKSLKKKIETVAKDIYRAGDVSYSPEAAKGLKELESIGFGKLPVCIAKTQYSFSDNPKLLGAPSGFEFHVRQVRLSAGAGFVVAFAGDIMTMPGLPKTPSSEYIDVEADGKINGLF